MAVSASDIIIYASANMPESDSTTSGGAWDNQTKILALDMQDAGGTDVLEVLSDSGGDSVQTLTVTGRNSGGSIVTDTFALNGTSVVTGAVSFERILKMVLDQVTTGTVTIRQSTTNSGVATMEGVSAAPGGTGVLTVRRPFYAATANASGGSNKELYEKVFVANTNTTNALLGATISISNDGTPHTGVDFRTSNYVEEAESTTNRLTAPTGTSGDWDNSEKPVPGIDLQPGSRCGLWLRLYLPNGQSPANSNITISVSGTTT